MVLRPSLLSLTMRRLHFRPYLLRSLPHKSKDLMSRPDCFHCLTDCPLTVLLFVTFVIYLLLLHYFCLIVCSFVTYVNNFQQLFSFLIILHKYSLAFLYIIAIGDGAFLKMPRPLSLPIVIHIFHIIPLLSLDSCMILREDIIIWEKGSARNVQIPRQQTALPCTTCAETAMRSLIRICIFRRYAHSAILPWIFLITLPRLKRIWQLWQRP